MVRGERGGGGASYCCCCSGRGDGIGCFLWGGRGVGPVKERFERHR